MSALTIQFREGGICLPNLALWLDAPRRRTGPERVFVSHAHSDHTAPHREVILSKPTSLFMRARRGGTRIEHVLPFGETRPFESGSGQFQMTLLPAGHILGSAMALVEAAGESLLYTGDFKLRRGLLAEPCDPSRAQGCDFLIMETTYGRPQYQFPPAHGVTEGIIQFCRQALDNDATPVLLAYSLGKSQELLCCLAGAGLPIMLHSQVAKLTQIHEQLGHRFPPYQPYAADAARNHVLVGPHSLARSSMFRGLRQPHVAVLTGWAMDANCRFRYGADAAFPFSDHADFSELVDFVELVRPRKVFTLHGFAADFALTLRSLGFDARSLSQDEQLTLPLEGFDTPTPATRPRRSPPAATLPA